MNKKLENQVIIVQNYNGNVAYEFTKMKSDMNNIYSEYNKRSYYMNKINTIINRMMSQKHNFLLENMYSPKY